MNYDIELQGGKHRLSIERVNGNGYRFRIDGESCDADAELLEPDILSLLIGGKSHRILFDPRPSGQAVVLDERRIPYRVHDPRSLRSRSGGDDGESGARSIVASMPGRIVRILVAPEDRVEAQQGLIVVEAMKMQNELKAPRAGMVTRVAVIVGATVQAGQVLVVIE